MQPSVASWMSWRVGPRVCASHHSCDGHVSSNWIHRSNTLGLKSSVADAESAAVTGDTTLVLEGGHSSGAGDSCDHRWKPKHIKDGELGSAS